MRLYNTKYYPLVGATIAALLTFQMPAPVMAASEPQPASVATPAAPVTAPAAPADSAPAPAAATAAEPAKPKPLPPTLIARINLTSQTMTVQVGGKPIHTWKVSTGAPGYATPPGTFKPGWMAQMWYSRQYDDAPMPHSVFFNGGIAVHATTSIGNLGRAASHGCVRLSPANAAAFYQLVTRHGMARTRIIVHGAQPFSQTADRVGKLNRQQAESRRKQRAAGGSAGQRWVIQSSTSGYAPRPVARSAIARDAYGVNRLPPHRATAAVVHRQNPYWVRQ